MVKVEIIIIIIEAPRLHHYQNHHHLKAPFISYQLDPF